jgi:uncharacterized protein DUF3999
MRPEALAAFLLGAAATAGAEVVRPVEAPGPGPVVVTLDRDVYERARADLGDLRVLDDTGRETPYLLARADVQAVPVRRPAIRDAGFVRGSKAVATLDFGAPTLKSHLALALSGDNFRRRVMVEGRLRRDPEWTTLVDQAYVFAVPPPFAARYETVALPENNHQILRVTVFNGDDDPQRIEIHDAWIGVEEHRRPREQPLEARVTRAEDAKARETVLTLDLGARHQPFRGIVVAAEDVRFWRGAAVEARIDPPPGATGAPLAWTFLGEGALYRMEAHGEVRESLRLDVAGRQRVLRVRIRNRDDAPLLGLTARVMAPVERLAFEAVPGRAYRLAYGDARRAAPSYDLARTAGDPQLFAARARDARLGVSSAEEAGAASRVPWTERHPALLWGGLVAAVLALGALTRKALAEA